MSPSPGSLAVSEVVRTLVFPLVLLLVGGALTGVLYPMITSRRQRDQKKREIRTALVSDISLEVMTIVMTVQFFQQDASLPKHDLDATYKHWEIGRSVIGTKLEAYFPDGGLGERWSDFAHRITRFYALLGIEDEADRALERRALLSASGESEDGNWGKVRDRLLNEKSALIREVMDRKNMRV